MTISSEDGNYVSMQEILHVCTQFQLNEKLQISISVLNIIAAIIAILGNLLVVIALKEVTSLHAPSKLLLRGLACADFCVGLTAQPLYLAFLMSQKERSEACQYVLTLFSITISIFGGVSKFTLAAISVDRLLALMLKLRYRQVVTFKRALIIVTAFWFSSTATALTTLVNFRLGVGVSEMELLVCTITSTVCYTKIYLTLRQHQARVHFHARQDQPNIAQNALDMAQYRKTICNAQWVQIVYLACSLPYGVIAAVFTIGGSLTPSLYVAWNVAFLIVLFKSAVNPFVYFWKIRAVRKAMKDSIIKLFSFLG